MTGNVLQAQSESTSSLSPAYESVRRRLALFGERLTRRSDYDQVWGWIDTWRQQLLAAGTDLPAPWVFASEDDVVELEWEIGSRFLWLRLLPIVPFQFSRIDAGTDPPLEEDGLIGIGEVKDLLAWVTG